MIEGRLRILEVMNTITHRVSLEEFTKMVGLTSNQTSDALQELEKSGFIRKIGQGYLLTENGKIALKVFAAIPESEKFHFYTGIGQYTGLSAKNLKDFYEFVKKVEVASLEFHASRGDFENWTRKVFEDTQLAKEFERIRKSNIKGESLRMEIARTTEERYRYFEKTFLPSKNIP